MGLTWLPPAYWLGQSPPTSRQEAGARARRAPATRQPPPASADAGRRLEDATRPPRLPLALAHSPPRLPLSLPRRPSAYLAADRRSCHHSHSLASPTSSLAPPRLPRPPHRATHRRRPYIAAFALVFNLGHPSHLRSIRRRQDLPELADPLSDPAVSSSSFSPSSRARLAPVAATSTAPESSPPPAMAPSWPEPQWLEAKLAFVLSAAPGARSHHQLSLPCTVVSKPTPPELRLSPRARFQRARSTPAPPTCPTRCARAPAMRRTKPRSIA